MDSDQKKVKACKEWLARRRAQLDQRKAQFENQYPLMPPRDNLKRMNDLEVWEFRIEIHEWELEQFGNEGETA